MDTLRLFVSSPGDVNEERIITERVLRRLSEEFATRVHLEPLFWEHEPMLATDTFQTQIPAPEEAQIFLCILWSKMGTRLPANIVREDGSRYASGTEYEFENAIKGFMEKGSPSLLIYRKMAEPPFLQNSRAPDFAEKLAQYQSLGSFFRKWFQDEEGSFTAAFNPFNDLAQFEERLETHLRKLLDRYYPPDGSQTQHTVTWKTGSPFRGLSPFNAEHAAVFFGRTKAIGEVLSALRKQAQDRRNFVLILGTSGSGKSSLVRAGVLPLLCSAGVIEGIAHWCQANVRPSDCSDDLVLGLAKALFAESALPVLDSQEQDIQNLYQLLSTSAIEGVPSYEEEQPELKAFITERLALIEQQHGLRSGQVRLVFFIDQLEEIFTLEETAHRARLNFARAIARLTRLEQIWGLATMRSDFYHHCADLADLVWLIEGSGNYLLSSPGVTEIGQMIRLPAFAAGLQFESRNNVRLDDVLLDAMAQNPQNLALLEFTLEALYQQRTNSDGMLTFAAYESMGGLEGALAKRAEALFASLPQPVQDASSTLLRALVTVEQDENAPVTSRAANYAQLAQDEQVAQLMEAFINERLLFTDQANNGNAVVRVSHEALLHHWPRIRDWLTQDRNLLRIRSRVAYAAQYWAAEGYSKSLLLSEGKPLNDALELLQEWGDDLEPELKFFIENSKKETDQRRYKNAQAALQEAQRRANLRRSRMLTTVFAVLALLAMLGGYLGYDGQQRAEKARNEAEAERDRAHLSEQAAERESAKARQAKRQVLRTQSLYLSSLAEQEVDWGNATNAMLLALAALPKSMTDPEKDFLTEAEAVLYKAVLNQRELAVLGAHESGVTRVALNQDSSRLLSLTERGQVRLWDVKLQRRLRLLRGHQRPVSQMSFSPDGHLFVTASWDGTAIIWGADNGSKLHALKGHENGISDARFSPDGMLVATASYDRSVRLWDVASGDFLRGFYGHKSDVTQVRFSPDGKYLLTASRDNTARLWDVASGEVVQVYAGHQDWVEQIAFTPDGKFIITASKDLRLRVWKPGSNRLQRQFSKPTRPVRSMMFHPQGDLLLTLSDDGYFCLWSFEAIARGEHEPLETREDVRFASFSPNGEYLLMLDNQESITIYDAYQRDPYLALSGHTSTPMQAVFSEDGALLASASLDRTVRLWQLEDGQQDKILRASQGELTQAHFSPNGRQLLGIGRSKIGMLWNIYDDPPTQQSLLGHEGSIYSGEFSPDGRWIATASADQSVILWDANDGHLVHRLLGHEHWVYHAAFSPDTRLLVSASWDQTARIWQVSDGQLLHTLKHDGGVYYAEFSIDGRQVVTASRDDSVRVWDAQTGDLLMHLKSPHGSVQQARFSRDGLHIIAASKNHILIWEAASGKLEHDLDKHTDYVYQLVLDQEGRYLATPSKDGTVRVWKLADGSEHLSLEGQGDYMLRAAFSPDSQYIATIGRDLSLALWDVKSGQHLVTMRGHNDLIQAVTFSPLGNFVATGSRDKTMRLWRIFRNTQDLIEYARSHVPRQLSQSQRQRFFLE